MAEDIKSPVFPESVFEGTLSNWLKKEGESFKQDEILAEIETDKVVIEVTAPKDGTIEKIIIPEGTTIKSSEVIGNFNVGENIKKSKSISTKEKANQATSPEKLKIKVNPKSSIHKKKDLGWGLPQKNF